MTDNDAIIRLLSNEPLKFEDVSDEPLRSTRNKSLSGFLTLVHKLLKSVMPEVRFTSAWPQGGPTNQDLPAITYKIISRTPSKGNQKPKFRTAFPDEECPGQQVMIYGQIFDVVLQFDIWADRSYEADGLGCAKDPNACRLALDNPALCNADLKPELCPYVIDGLMDRFENFMFEYTGFFMDQVGVQQLYLLEQTEDAQDVATNTPVIKRSLRYFLRSERVSIYKTADLINVDVLTDVEDLTKEE